MQETQETQETPAWSWHAGDDPAAIHALLLASDQHHAAVYGLPAPTRRVETSERLALANAVQMLMYGDAPVAMFALTSEPAFTEETGLFPAVRSPVYLQRLAIAPGWLERVPLLGARCLRRAVELAEELGADAIRSEANPDLSATVELLSTFGFARYGPILSSANGLRRIYLQKDL